VSTPRQQQGGLSLQTLVIASAASVAAAIVVHKLWKGGAILGAAITPVIVAIVSETLRKPVERVTSIREVRRTRPEAGSGQVPPPAPEPARPDPYGIWQQERLPWWRRRSSKVAVVTGLLAFVIGAFALTASELVFGGSVGGGNDRLTLPVGGKKDTSRDERTRTTETQPQDSETPAETTPTAPADEQEVPTTETPPPTQTTPIPPVTPTPTEPAPTPTETAPPPDPAAPTP
jgi:hypothetical protein